MKLSKLFMTGMVDEEGKAPIFHVDVACQTDDLMAVARYWHPDRKQHDILRSLLTDMFEVFDTSIEQMDWSASDDSDRSETDYSNDSSLKYNSYMCISGSCPHYMETASDASRISKQRFKQRRTTRLLHVFTIFDEAT